MSKKEVLLKKISIVVPSFNEQDNVSVLFEKINEQLSSVDFEVIFVDDGSSDDTLKNLIKLSEKHKAVKYLSFSRNFGHQAALRAGLRVAKGDGVISMDADLQHPPEILPKLIALWSDGYDIVYTTRDDDKAEKISYLRKKSSLVFYNLINKLSGLSIDPGAADFRLLDRKVVDEINKFPEPELFLRGLVNWIGYRSIAVSYAPAKRFSGNSKYSFKKLLNFALSGITQFSIKPLRMSIVIGFLMSGFGALYGIYALAQYFISSNNASGWTSLIIVVLITSGLQMILLGVVGEYVGKTFMQTKQRPDYIVANTNIINSKEG